VERVKTFGFRDNFIGELAGFVNENMIQKGVDPGRIAFVFGGKRPSLFLKKELAKMIGRGFYSPACFSMDEFVDHLLNKADDFSPISDLDASYIIYRLADELYPSITRGRKSFSRFLPWAREILSFIEQLDLEAITAPSLDLTQVSATIGYDVPKTINMLLKHVVEIRKKYHAKLEEKKTYTKGLRYLKASRSSKAAGLEEFDAILFCNFFFLNRTEKDIIKGVYDSGKGLLIFQGDQKDWPVLESLSKELNCSIRPERDDRAKFDLEIRAGFDLHSQACIVREELKKFKRDENTVVVLPDEGSLIPLLSEIATDITDCNVSMGYPLKRSSLYSLFESIFAAAKTKKNSEFYTRDYLRALKHPIAKNFKFINDEPSITRVVVHKIEEHLLGIEESPLNGRIFIGLKEIEDLSGILKSTADTLNSMGIDVEEQSLAGIIAKIHGLLFYPWENVSDFQALSEVIEDFVLKIIKSGYSGDYPINLKVAQTVLDIKDQFKTSAFSREMFPRDELFKIFLDILGEKKFKFSGSPLKGLQVLGMLETRALNFENVIIMDANEGALPQIKINEPLIPRDVKIGLGLAVEEREEELQRYHFVRLISGAKNVLIVYKDDKETEMSRFMEELIWKEQREAKTLEAANPTGVRFAQPKASGKKKIKKTGGMIEYLKTRNYSASSVRTYLNCPLSYYFKYILGLKEIEGIAGDPEGKDVGTFVHDLLRDTFSRFKGKKPVINSDFEIYFNDEFNKKFDDEFVKRMRSDSFLLREVMASRLKKFLEMEKIRSAAIERIEDLEKEVAGVIEAGGHAFSFSRARIDRIDKLSDGSSLIIDYKTGASEVPKKDLSALEVEGYSRRSIKENIKDLQLPIYIYLAGGEKGIDDYGAALYRMKEREKWMLELFEGLDAVKRREAFGICMKALRVLLLEMVDPDVPFEADDEDPRNCEYCEFKNLCR
jgi:CRISPR/Cas system-associated exonuclease Cas4 (RecB family)